MSGTAVFGSVFVDIKGFPFGRYQPTGRNVGEVKIVHGGVCRNVAENLANVGSPVSFVTMFEPGPFGDAVRRRLESRGVDLKYAVEAERGMGMWLAVMNERGDLAGSISRQPDFAAMEALVERHGDEIVADCDNLVVEIDMCASVAERLLSLARIHGRDVYVLVGNMSVILAHPEYLSQVRLFIMNEIEAGNLFGVRLDPRMPDSVLEITRREALRRGMREIVVPLGAHGSVYFDAQSGESGCVEAEQTQMVDSTGAGDAFFSGAVAARMRGMSLGEAARLGARLAALTLRSDESTCPQVQDFFPPRAAAV